MSEFSFVIVEFDINFVIKRWNEKLSHERRSISWIWNWKRSYFEFILMIVSWLFALIEFISLFGCPFWLLIYSWKIIYGYYCWIFLLNWLSRFLFLISFLLNFKLILLLNIMRILLLYSVDEGWLKRSEKKIRVLGWNKRDEKQKERIE